MNINDLDKSVDLIRRCLSGDISVDNFATDYFELSQDFCWPPQLPPHISNREELEELFSELRGDCAQFQPNPNLYEELVQSSEPGSFLNQKEFKERLEVVATKLKEFGVFFPNRT